MDLKNFEHFELTESPATGEIPSQVRRDIVPVAHLEHHVEHIGVERPVMVKLHDGSRDMDAFYGPRSVFSVPQFHGGPDVGHMTSTGIFWFLMSWSSIDWLIDRFIFRVRE